ncbi:MAG TPA: FeoB-associated Cys-rich membrane protein [Mobilitalea sp.]|nr:FeoB-associated Cys-rich membrane protein [Mobilitalea sp.]
MVEVIIGAIILAYTGLIVYRRIRNLKLGNSCCGGCSACASKGKCKQ